MRSEFGVIEFLDSILDVVVTSKLNYSSTISGDICVTYFSSFSHVILNK